MGNLNSGIIFGDDRGDLRGPPVLRGEDPAGIVGMRPNLSGGYDELNSGELIFRGAKVARR